jgi:surface antigen
MLLKIGAGVLSVGVLGGLFFSTLVGAFTFQTNTFAMGGSNGQVVAAASLMAAHLSGPRAQNYGTDFPQAVVHYWASVCPEQGTDPTKGCYPDWQSGNLQCVLFVSGAYALANQPLPASGNAIDFWSLYQGRAGWKEIPTSPTTPAAQRGLPAAGDIMVWSDDPKFVKEAFGHVAIVLSVTPPSAGTDGSVTFAEANGPGSVVSQPIAPDLTVATWVHYTVLGYIRSPLSSGGMNLSTRVRRISQLDPAQYNSTADYNTWAYSACSTAVITELLDALGANYRIADVLKVEAARGDITPKLGLVDDAAFADTADQFGVQTSWGHTLTYDQVISIANGGTPVAVGFPPDRYAGGHLLIVVGGDADTVLVVDSSAHNYPSISRAQFMQWWGGFSAIVSPKGTPASGPLPNSPYVATAQADATAFGLPPDLFVRQINVESGFNPNALSPAGAEGIAQFEPGTAAGLGVNPWDPVQALRAAAHLMATYVATYGGDYGKALAAYNFGAGDAQAGTGLAGALQRCGVQWFGCLPAETQNYINAILGGP